MSYSKITWAYRSPDAAFICMQMRFKVALTIDAVNATNRMKCTVIFPTDLHNSQRNVDCHMTYDYLCVITDECVNKRVKKLSTSDKSRRKYT